MDQFEGFSEDITKWEVIRNMVDLDLNDDCNIHPTKSKPRVHLLPRKTLSMYGSIPKVEQKIYVKCKECKLIFNPRNILSHKVCPSKIHSIGFDIKKKFKSKSSKKSHSNTPSPPPFKKPLSPSSPIIPLPVTDLSKTLSPKSSKTPASLPITTSSLSNSSSHKSSSKVSSASKNISSHIPKSPKSEHSSHSSSKSSKSSSNGSESSNGSSTSKSSSSSSHNSSGSSSSRHRKSRKSSSSHSKTNEKHEHSNHSGNTENKVPSKKSVDSSSQRSHLKKLISSRTKDIHHLLAERKTSKERDTKHSNTKSHNSPNGIELKDVGEPYVSAPVKTNSLSVLLPKPKENYVKQNSTSKKQHIFDLTDFDTKFSNSDEAVMNQDSDAGTVPVMYMPISPVSVVTPVEYVKIGKNIIRLESPQSANSPPLTTHQSTVYEIPNNINVKMYHSHPKPVTMPSYGAKNIGGAILLSKYELELQRNDFLLTICSNSGMVSNMDTYKTSMNSSALYKPNILKTKNSSKSSSAKRSSSDKNNATDNKQMRYSSNLNGFQIHSTLSETADAPSNISMNDKMSYFNMNK